MYRVNQMAWRCLPALLAGFALLTMLACGGGTSTSRGVPGDSSFNLQLSPSALSFARGNQSYTTLSTTAVGDFGDFITASASGVPEGVTVSFDPAIIPPSGSANVTVAIGPETATGSYAIVVTGSARGMVKSATLALTVAAQVNLTWQASDSRNVVGYHVGRSTIPGRGYVRLDSQLISETSYVDQTAESNHTYYYVVTAVDSADRESAPSNEASATVR